MSSPKFQHLEKFTTQTQSPPPKFPPRPPRLGETTYPDVNRICLAEARRAQRFVLCNMEISMNNLPTDAVTGAIIEAAINIHKSLGPGLLESVYERVLASELERRGYEVQRQKPVSFEYDGMVFEDAYRVDLIVNQCVVVEIKSIEAIAPVHCKQTLTYLRLLGLQVALLINFGEATIREGLRRFVNNFDDSLSERPVTTS